MLYIVEKPQNMISGIYTITNLVNNKIYVGSSIECEKRGKGHFTALKNNKHSNPYLQASYNKHGEKNFKFEILEKHDEKYLLSFENYWGHMLDSWNRKIGYNIRFINPDKNRLSSFPEETRLKMSQARLGIKLSDEVKLSMKNKWWDKRKDYFIPSGLGKFGRYSCARKKILQFDKSMVFIKEWECIKEAAEYYSLVPSSISTALITKRPSMGFIWKYKKQKENDI